MSNASSSFFVFVVAFCFGSCLLFGSCLRSGRLPRRAILAVAVVAPGLQTGAFAIFDFPPPQLSSVHAEIRRGEKSEPLPKGSARFCFSEINFQRVNSRLWSLRFFRWAFR